MKPLLRSNLLVQFSAISFVLLVAIAVAISMVLTTTLSRDIDLAVQTMAHNLARWTARIGLGERIATTKTLRRRFFSLAGRLEAETARP